MSFFFGLNQNLFAVLSVDNASYVYVTNPGNDQNIVPNIISAYNSTKAGDTIVIPAGTFKWIGNVTFTTVVSLKGAGKNSTILYIPETVADASIAEESCLTFNVNQDTPCGIVISDFTLKSKIPTSSEAIDYGIIINKAYNFIVRNCRFENFGYSGIEVWHKNNIVGGLIHNNEFIHNYKGTDGLGLGYGVSVYGENGWNTSAGFGTSNFIFIEDNYFDSHRHSIAGGGSGLYVARYNDFKDNLLSSAVDMHESRGSSPNLYSTRAVEVYNNNFYNTTYIDGVPVSDIPPYHAVDAEHTNGNALAQYAIGLRGGESLIYGNDFKYVKISVEIMAIYHAETGDSDVYPYTGQIGYNSAIVYGASDSGTDSAHGDGDCFIWNNTWQPYGPATPYNAFFLNDDPTFLVEGRDYHFVAKPNYVAYTYPHPLR